jgi:hypothetical protein
MPRWDVFFPFFLSFFLSFFPFFKERPGVPRLCVHGLRYIPYMTCNPLQKGGKQCDSIAQIPFFIQRAVCRGSALRIPAPSRVGLAPKLQAAERKSESESESESEGERERRRKREKETATTSVQPRTTHPKPPSSPLRPLPPPAPNSPPRGFLLFSGARRQQQQHPPNDPQRRAVVPHFCLFLILFAIGRLNFCCNSPSDRSVGFKLEVRSWELGV